LFALAQLAGGWALDHLWLSARNPLQAQMYACLEARRRTPEIMFLGSSRFESNINCDVVDAELRRVLGESAPRTFNAALPAADGTVFERLFDDVCRNGRTPRMLVVEIHPGTVARRDNWLHMHALNVLDWRDVPEAFPALCRNGHVTDLLRGRLLPLYLHRYHIRKAARSLLTSGPFSAPPHPPGDPAVPPPVAFDPEPPALTPALRALQEKGYTTSAKELQDYRVDGMAPRGLERLLDRCRRSGIPVVLVGVPVSSPYQRATTPEIDAAFLEYVGHLEQCYGCSYSDWRTRLADGYFIDGHHANPAGAVFFSRHLAAELLADRWRDFQQSAVANAAGSNR
jgi:hypothetical protein